VLQLSVPSQFAFYVYLLNRSSYFENFKHSEFFFTLPLNCRKNGKNHTKKTTPKMPFLAITEDKHGWSEKRSSVKNGW